MTTGIICSILLLTKSDKKQSNKFLALGILSFCWLNTKILLHSFDLWKIHGFGFFPNGIELALPPLFFFYVVSFVNPKFEFRNKDWLHYIPFFASQVYAIVVYIAIMKTNILSEKRLIADLFSFNQVKEIEEYLLQISTIIYLYFAFRHIQNYKKWLSNTTSDTQFSELNFLNNIVIWFSLISIYTIINLGLNYFLDSSYNWRWKLDHLIIATLVYYMGLIGYKNSDIILKGFSNNSNKKSLKEVDLKLIAQLDQAIKMNKIYLDPKLNLQQVAQMLDVNETILSNTINIHYKKNFRNLINEARVKEVKHRLLTEEIGNLSLLGFAVECGFNSEASFYRIFKTETNLTPKQFIKSHSLAPDLKKI